MMKIISLHINNFGKLSNYDYSFRNVSSFIEENGYGKSTIAAFIKAMLFGLETYKSNAAKFLDRKHYFPFKGGNFGGYLVIEYQNKNYRIERSFDEKSEIKDKLTVYVNDNVTDELGLIPGETIFGINKDSFERLISIDSDKISIEADNDINKKLNNYVENISEDFDIDKINKTLKDIKKVNNESLKQTKDNIKKTIDEISNLENIKISLDGKYDELHDLEKECHIAKKDYSLAVELDSLLDKWVNYDQLLADIKDKERICLELNKKFPKGIPSDDVLKNNLEVENKIANLKASITSLNISSNDQNDYDALCKQYNGKVDDDKIKRIETDVNKFYSLKEDVKKLTNNNEQDATLSLDKRFKDVIISDEEFVGIENKINEYDSFDKSVVNNEQGSKTDSNKLFITLLVVSLLVVLTGIGIIFANITIGIILLVVGLVGLGVDLLLYFNNVLKNVKNVSGNALNNDKKGLAINDINAFLDKYGYDKDNFIVSFYKLKNDYYQYQDYLQKEKARINKLKDLENELSDLDKSINDFFANLSFEKNEHRYNLELLKKDLIKLNTLNDVASNVNNNKIAMQKELKELDSKHADFYKAFDLNQNLKLSEIMNQISDLKRANREKENANKKAEDYKLNNKLDIRPDKTLNKSDLSNKYDDLNKKLVFLKNDINHLEDDVNKLDDQKNTLCNLKEDKDRFDKKNHLFEALINEINKADQDLKEKYVAPIKNRFVEYASMLEETIGEKVHMDKNYKIYFDKEGALRSFEHLSSGNLAICALCFRLAILDNMFQEEKPFIIMDDPFVALDEKHFEKVNNLIEKLSKDKQIIYFTCHKSRELKI